MEAWQLSPRSWWAERTDSCPDVPPADPAARAAQHAEARAEAATAGKLTDEEVDAMRVKVRAMAPRLTAFGLGSFGWYEEDEECDVDREHAELAAAAGVVLQQGLCSAAAN
ncbi:hypothetical protein [Streptomyces nigrescens]